MVSYGQYRILEALDAEGPMGQRALAKTLGIRPVSVSEAVSRLATMGLLLTSLRTIAGAMGTALFVGIMETIAGSSTGSGLSAVDASMRGLNVTYLAMAFVAAAMLIIGVANSALRGPSSSAR